MSFSPRTHRVAPVLSWNICSVTMKRVQIQFCTGGKKTKTVIFQYLILFVLTFSWQKHILYTTSSPASLRGKLREEKMSVANGEGQSQLTAAASSVRRWAEDWARLDFENKNVKVAGNLVANTDTVTHQVKEGNDLQERQRERKKNNSFLTGNTSTHSGSPLKPGTRDNWRKTGFRIHGWKNRISHRCSSVCVTILLISSLRLRILICLPCQFFFFPSWS